jgi:hypothetical protein
MADYPDWVMKFKEKGTYINYTNGRYYLYAAHSERVLGTDKVKRVCDGYLGRITEKDGLIPSRDKVTGNVEIFDFIMIAAVLSAIYGFCDNSLFRQSFLSIRFPGLDLGKNTTQKQQTAIERGILMINDTLSSFFKEQSAYAMLHLGTVYKVRINGRFYLSKESGIVETLKQNLHIDWVD